MGSGEPLPSNWVYGGVFHQNNRGESFYIIYSYDPIEKHAVYADTVGQFTGITDKNGTKIFEGDIIKYYDPCSDPKGYQVCKVEFDEEYCRVVVRFHRLLKAYLIKRNEEYYEVIGNIYDNPDLFKY